MAQVNFPAMAQATTMSEATGTTQRPRGLKVRNPAKLPRTPVGPVLNVDDMPEWMPGAQPSANPVQKDRFDKRCKQLHYQEEAEHQEEVEENLAASGSGAGGSDLEAMFPTLDAALVRTLFAEAPTPQAGIDMLLALSAATNEPGGTDSGQRAKSPPPRDLGVQDMQKFPSLTDADGWQCVSKAQFERDPDAELGTDWAKTAKVGAGAPDPEKPKRPMGVWGQPRREKKQDDEAKPEVEPKMTDYELRHGIGQKRAQNRVQYGRGRGGKAAGKGYSGAGRGRGSGDSSEVSEDEEEDLGGGGGGGAHEEEEEKMDEAELAAI